MSSRLSSEEVRHIARLARLRLPASDIERYRTQLSSVLDYVAQLQRIDVTGVEPMAHPLDIVNRLDGDDVGPTMPLEEVLRNAPAAEGPFLSVPKVLDEGGA